MRLTLQRQDCLVGSELADYLDLDPEENMTERADAPISSCESDQPWTSFLGQRDGDETARRRAEGAVAADLEGPLLSPFEAVFTNYPPVLESLLAHITTSSLLDLYHTSKYLRDFLKKYPLAWKTLSFRLPQPAVAMATPGNETPDSRERQSKAYAFDALLKQTVGPNGAVLTSLDLCNTAVSGTALTMQVLGPHSGTLRCLSPTPADQLTLTSAGTCPFAVARTCRSSTTLFPFSNLLPWIKCPTPLPFLL